MLSPVAWRTPPRQYGAWETVASNITEGLQGRGWDVTLFATGDSITKAKLRSVVPRGYEEDKSVDAKDLNYLDEVLADDVRFRIGNNDVVAGKQAVLDANRGFFASIESMSHKIDNAWTVNEDVICNGRVDYVRLDGSTFTAPFATVLKLQKNKIIDYLVYADVSAL